MLPDYVTEMKAIGKIENFPLEFSVQLFWNFLFKSSEFSFLNFLLKGHSAMANFKRVEA